MPRPRRASTAVWRQRWRSRLRRRGGRSRSRTRERPRSARRAMVMRADSLGIIDTDAVDFVGDVLEGVGHSLEIFEYLASDCELQRVGPCILERPPQPRRMNLVGSAFETNQPRRQFM